MRIGRTEVRAPVAGLISRRSAKFGAAAALSGDPLFRIIADGAVDPGVEVKGDKFARVFGCGGHGSRFMDDHLSLCEG